MPSLLFPDDPDTLPAWWNNAPGAEQLHPDSLTPPPPPGSLLSRAGTGLGAIMDDPMMAVNRFRDATGQWITQNPTDAGTAFAGLNPVVGTALGAGDVASGVAGIARSLWKGDVEGTRPYALQAGLGFLGTIPVLGAITRKAEPEILAAARAARGASDVMRPAESLLPDVAAGAPKVAAPGELESLLKTAPPPGAPAPLQYRPPAPTPAAPSLLSSAPADVADASALPPLPDITTGPPPPRARRDSGPAGTSGSYGDTTVRVTSRQPDGSEVPHTQVMANRVAQRIDDHYGNDGIDLYGAGANQPGGVVKVTVPPHIRFQGDLQADDDRLVDAATQGAHGRNWYKQGGESMMSATGDDPDAASRLAAGFAYTSPSTSMPVNTTMGIRAWNQSLLGDPIETGIFPGTASPKVAGSLTGDELPGTRKVGPFYWNHLQYMEPDLPPMMGHNQGPPMFTKPPPNVTNDIWAMRGAGFKGDDGGVYNGTPTTGEDNWVRHSYQRAMKTLNDNNVDGGGWTPDQVQAAIWTHTKAMQETGQPADPSKAFNFGTGLDQNMAQQSWESAPGTTDPTHMPEYHSAPWDRKQAYHDAINEVLTDPQGRDIINQHFGLLTGQTVHGPGVFNGTVSPGSQAQAAVSSTAGRGLDPGQADLLNMAERTRALLLQQDAFAWHKPIYQKSLTWEQKNLADFEHDAPLTPDQAQTAAALMKQHTGYAFSPIPSAKGTRFQNFPDSGVDNQRFQTGAQAAMDQLDLPGAQKYFQRHAEGNFEANHWTENPNGQVYVNGIASGRPHLQRASDEILAALGPKIGAVQDRFAASDGWSPNRAGRVWETPGFQDRYQGVSVPAPRRPWVRPFSPDEPGSVLPGLLGLKPPTQ